MPAKRIRTAALRPDDIVRVLTDAGAIEVPKADHSPKPVVRDDASKARCFRLKRGRYVYVKIKPRDHGAAKAHALVVAPSDESFTRTYAPDVIRAKVGYTHGTMFGRFPTRQHRGKNDIPYGVAVDIDDAVALGAFISALDAR